MPDYSLYSGDTGDEDERDRVFRALIGEQAAQPYHDETPPPQTRVEATGRAAAAGGDDDLRQALHDRAMQELASSGQSAPVERQTAEGPNWTAAIGSLGGLAIDAAMNRGRGAGAIVAATAQNMDADRRLEQQRLDRLTEIEARKKESKDPLSAYIAYGNLQERTRERENVKEERVAQAAANQRAKLEPNSIEAQGAGDVVYNQAGDRTRGRLDVQHELNDRTGTDRADVLGKGQQAIADVKHENAPRVSSDKAADIEIVTPATAGRAAAVAEAQLPSKERLQQNAHDLQMTGPSGGRPAFPDSDILDPEAWGSLDKGTFAKEKAQHEADVQQDQALEKMKAVRARGGIQPFSGQDKSEYQAAYAQLQGAQAKKAALGTLQEGERKILEGIDPTLDPHMSDAKDWILNKFVSGDEPKHDTVLEQLTGLQKQGRDSAEVRAAVSGYKPRWGAPAAAAAPPPNTVSTPGQVTVPDTSGGETLGPRVPLPKQPISDSAPTMRTIHYPDGLTETHMLDEQAINRLLKAAPKGTEVF